MAKPVAVYQASHAFRETRDVHPEDIRLRANGFKIQSRAKGKPAMWRLGEETFTHQEALDLCDDTEE